MLVYALVGRVIPNEMRYPPLTVGRFSQECHEIPSGLPSFDRFLVFNGPSHGASTTHVANIPTSTDLIERLNEARDRGLSSTGGPPEFVNSSHSDHWG